MKVTMTPTAIEIVKSLIRNKFDVLQPHELRTTGATLISIAREMGFTEMANQMHNDYLYETSAAA